MKITHTRLNHALIVLFTLFTAHASSAQTAAPNACPVGQIETNFGCLSQGDCMANTGNYNGMCVTGIAADSAANAKSTPPAIPTNSAFSISGTYNSCDYGYVSTVYGCAPQLPCVPGYGYIKDRCYSALPGMLSSPTQPTQPAPSTKCASSMVNTLYGCAPQGDCLSGYGEMNHMCYQAIPENVSTFFANPGYPDSASIAPTGFVSTSRGMLPVGTCGEYPGYGFENGYCVK
jgi:hypothetical protein